MAGTDPGPSFGSVPCKAPGLWGFPSPSTGSSKGSCSVYPAEAQLLVPGECVLEARTHAHTRTHTPSDAPDHMGSRPSRTGTPSAVSGLHLLYLGPGRVALAQQGTGTNFELTS